MIKPSLKRTAPAVDCASLDQTIFKAFNTALKINAYLTMGVK